MEMPEYISRETLRDLMYTEAFDRDTGLQRWDSGLWIRFKLFENCLDAIPAADVVERKSARWKGAGLGDYYCSLCNETYSIGAERVNDWHFCPNCGADMRPDPLKEVDGTKL